MVKGAVLLFITHKFNFSCKRSGEYFKILNKLLDAEMDEKLDALLRELDKN